MSLKLPAKLPRPKAIIFDWDNTLVDTWPIIHTALTDTFVQMNKAPWTLEEVKSRVGKSMRDHFPELFGDKWKQAGDIYLHSYKTHSLDKLEGLYGAEDMLELLATTKIYTALASNKQGPTLRREAEFMGWTKYFQKLVGASDAARDKPHADPALLALDGSGIKASAEVWFVGDSITDVDCAIAANLTPIIYGNELLAKQFPEYYHAENHAQLKDLINDHS